MKYIKLFDHYEVEEFPTFTDWAKNRSSFTDYEINLIKQSVNTNLIVKVFPEVPTISREKNEIHVYYNDTTEFTITKSGTTFYVFFGESVGSRKSFSCKSIHDVLDLLCSKKFC